MFVMLFFYWRIYKAAVRTTKAINQGFRTTKGEDRLIRNINYVGLQNLSDQYVLLREMLSLKNGSILFKLQIMKLKYFF